MAKNAKARDNSGKRPVSFYHLRGACANLMMLLSCTDEWELEDNGRALASEIRHHLVAVADALEKSIQWRRFERKNRLDEVVSVEFADLREHLVGRSYIYRFEDHSH